MAELTPEPTPARPVPVGEERIIWIVGAQQGEYSDRTEWTVVACNEEAEAKRITERLGQLWRHLVAEYKRREDELDHAGDWDGQAVFDAPEGREFVALGERQLGLNSIYADDRMYFCGSIRLLATEAQPSDGAGVPDHARVYVGDGLYARFDWQDWDLVSPYLWRLTTRIEGATRYAQAWSYPKDGGPRKRIAMHRLLLPGSHLVDHINGDGLDNRRANLRPATHQQNAFNRKPRAGTSQYKGVNFDKASGLWRAVIRINGKKTTIGRFATEQDAAKAYNSSAAEAFGGFGRLNNVQ